MTKREKAREYFGILDKPELILHHKDTTLRHNDIERYNEWRPEDLEVMTQSEHLSLHNKLNNPMSNEETAKKSSKSLKEFNKKHKNDEKYIIARSKAVSSRNKTLWKDEEYRKYMIDVMHANQCIKVLDTSTNKEYKSINEAARDTGLSKYKICNSANRGCSYGTHQFEFI